jgi:hypothetical protein
MKKMKKLKFGFAALLAAVALISCGGEEKKEEKKALSQEHALQLFHGRFAFCGASPAELTGKKIVVEGDTFLEGCSTCPVMEGTAFVNVLLVGNPYITPDSTSKTVWSYGWYFDSVPQAPTWKNLPTVSRTFTITEKPGGGMSNMWCMPCRVLPNKVNGVTLAKCYGPINEMPFPMRRSVRALPGEKVITQAPVGAPYPVGAVIPDADSTENYKKLSK